MSDEATTTPATQAQTYDAVSYPEGWEPPNQADHDRLTRLEKHIQPLIGGRKVHFIVGNPVLATFSPYETFYFPKGHRLDGFPRYDWTDGPNGARYGKLKPEATA